MQTFLPYPDFQQSAAVLDRARLGKQRVEALQTLRALVIPEYGWQSHPAIRMWMGYVPALTMYGLAMVDEWVARGGEDTTRAKILEFAPQAGHAAYAAKIPMPPWLGEPDVHLSHRSRLMQKEPRFYSELFPGTPADLEYVWPEPRHEFLPEDPVGDRLWILRAPVADTRPEKLDIVSLPEVGRAAKAAAQSEDYEFVYADDTSRRPAKNPKKRPPKQLVKKPTRKRQRQEEAFRTLPGNTELAVPFDGGATFAIGRVQGRPITVDGRFARNFQVTDVVERSSFDYPALLQDPRVFFPIPAR
ncbi:MSMEG_6728 family protein [Arthrobacter sp. B10-11]|uniref:MSMEG_6728 family protein n=1 Tax=Arthrobacter sp. B10-11 TaxID=3081160 RepID=UPI0029529D03|nr:MSMEG_6728 family protein [Arthrobacter sp. B10-11]MDV8149630.1 MSMEG_6728 family protein [Arthrobacter sp. B10-11]